MGNLEAERYLIYNPDFSISERLHKIDPTTKSAAEAIAAAEKVFEEYRPLYEAALAEDIKSLNLLAAAPYDDSESSKQELGAKIYRLAHDIKGQGKICGFDIISDITALLCDFMNHVGSKSPHFHTIIEQHISAVDLIYKNQIRGAGTPETQGLLNSLHTIIANAHPPVAESKA